MHGHVRATTGVDALGLPAAAVLDRRAVTAAEDPHKLLQTLQTWHESGLAVAGWLGWEFGTALAGLPQPEPHDDTVAELTAFAPASLEPLALPTAPMGPPCPFDGWHALEAPFRAQVAAALEAIAAGEIYQVNLSVALQVATAGRHCGDLATCLAAVLAVQPVVPVAQPQRLSASHTSV